MLNASRRNSTCLQAHAPHQVTLRPRQHNQAPREHTPPSSAHPVSREELHSAIANMYHNIQDMFTKLLNQRKEETTMPVDVRNTNNTSRRNRTRSSSCQSCSPPREQSPTPSVAPENSITTRLHQEKMLQNLIRAPEVKFDGKDSQDYAPWKRALQKEMESLNLTSNQELSLLEARTEDEANMVIKELRPLRNELGPDRALRRIWETLDQTYYNPISQVQSLLKKLTQGTDVKAEDASALLTLTLQCQSALALHRHKPIASLEDHTTVDAVVGRLDKVLRREWFTHVQTLPAHHAHMPTFQDFASWIQQKSQIARLDRSSRHDRDKYKPNSGSAHAEVVPKTASSVPTPPSLPKTAQTQKMRSPLPKAPRSTPGGGKEYRDAIRSSKSPPHASTFNINMPESAYHSPSTPRSRDTSPKTNKLWCAWCTEHGLAYNHSTANCYKLAIADANDQWRVINNQKVCDSCLVQGHHWRYCPNKFQKRCTKCGNSHHPILLCMPPKQSSTYPGAG